MKKQNKTFCAPTLDECYEEANAWSITKALCGRPAKNMKRKEWRDRKNRWHVSITYTD